MFGKTTLLVGAGAGYVLGARAGRERYDQIVAQVDRLRREPKIREGLSEAQDAVATTASAVKDKAASAGSDGSSDPDDAAASSPSSYSSEPPTHQSSPYG